MTAISQGLNEGVHTAGAARGATSIGGAASIDGPIVGTAKRNTVVTEIDHDGNWIKIQAPGANGVVEGWVNQRMLEEIKPQP